ncbi:DoxX family protein [Dyella nitratireducens]|uniref:DoxX family protein n=1 Tax=Dyella nitratireducens TaxID=1849580 RepID=A0ABQ1FK36_9GAMM|nr:DoxX family protein [Dyella nitratireducens]GGA19496.1 hypothetical protein GCM10010981_04380 [Dyella nitratireducens]GLQ44501.1 hypothetical protein GCM10007902_43510 [Dyella nitratireducens]
MAANYAYWISTALLSLLYLTSATMYIAKREWVRQNLVELGYPGYLVSVLTVVKILAVVAILSRFSVPLSDLAYAGIFYHLLLALLAHVGVRKPGAALPAFVGLVLLTVSFTTQNTARGVPSPHGVTAAVHQVTLNERS